MPTILSGRDLAERLGMRYEDVMLLARSGEIPSIRSGRRVAFNLDRVLDALEESTAGGGKSLQLAGRA
jgi:excisionase family DNA binding protein